jgi:hypothetical protein
MIFLLFRRRKTYRFILPRGSKKSSRIAFKRPANDNKGFSKRLYDAIIKAEYT